MPKCSSDPTSGCDNSEIVAAIDAQTTTLAALITAGNTTLTDIKTANADCCESINAKLQQEIDLLTNINDQI